MAKKKLINTCCRCKVELPPPQGWCARCMDEEFPELRPGGLASLTVEERSMAMLRAFVPRRPSDSQ